MLSDYLKDGLDVIFCGINPGYKSAENGHHFYNPTNHFWRCLHSSGLTSTLLHPSEDYTLPDDFNLGLTNLVDRPSAEQSELSKDEMIKSVPTLLAKITRFRPRFVCFVGMGIWEVVREGLLQTVSSPLADGNKSIKVKGKKPASLGLQPYKYVHPRPLVSGTDAITETLLFVVPSTSGRVVRYQLTDKITFFETLKDLKEMKQSDIDTSDMLAIYS
ncbi:hypothetical protein SERLADRAFT_456783 [Serpula lacrymans var. lacrymans S7.9]|nr:uncharacterized protein SERLADRAFT_456783 [Serpula lacrymans var. lacrymans S7.9]EGO29256.1 hypothetical protein SERLADRAFT_456783 [Serpula lacrymans var. lacrymans S7.9]